MRGSLESIFRGAAQVRLENLTHSTVGDDFLRGTNRHALT